MSAGGDCAETISGETSRLTLDEYLAFLEPQLEPERAGALCQSAADWGRLKTAFEQACRKLGARCTKEIVAQFEAISYTAGDLQANAIKKKKQAVKP